MGAVIGGRNLKCDWRPRAGGFRPERRRGDKLAGHGRESDSSPTCRACRTFGTAGVVNYQDVVGRAGHAQLARAARSSGRRLSGRDDEGHDPQGKRHLLCLLRALQAGRRDRNGGKRSIRVYGGPEYETLGTFGSYCGVGDLEGDSAAHQIAPGGDGHHSGGATIAFAMECFERGILTPEDTGGVELSSATRTR